MPETTTEEYKSFLLEKNLLIVKVMHERESLSADEKLKTELRIAELEGKIAGYLLSINKPEDACVNLISQATALCKIGFTDEAIKIFASVHEKTNKQSLKAWVVSEITRLRSSDNA
jgi:hypothetical protein